MGKLSEYSEIEEKSDFFDENIVVNTKKEFDDVFDNVKKIKNARGYKERVVFRDVCEAKYKLYASSQRFWVENELENQ